MSSEVSADEKKNESNIYEIKEKKESRPSKVSKVSSINENKKEEWEQKEEGDWSHIIDWQLNKDEYKDISTKVFYFQVNEKLRGNKTKFKGEGEIALSKLNKENIFSDNFEFKLKTNRMISPLIP